MKLDRQVKAVVFDMDGLLLDTERLYLRAFIEQAEAMGHVLPDQTVRLVIGNTWAGSLAILAERFGPEFDPDVFKNGVLARFYSLAETDLCLKEGVLDLLDHLETVGLPRAICTSSRRDEVEHHTRATDIFGRFNAIVAQGDCERGKPHPDPYLEAARRLGVDPANCLALEDSYNGIRSASAAGMMAVMVPDLLDPTDEMHALCAGIVESLKSVKQHLVGVGQGSAQHDLTPLHPSSQTLER